MIKYILLLLSTRHSPALHLTPLYIAVIDRVSFQKGLGVLFVWEQNVQITGWNSNFSLYGYPGKHAIVGEKSTGDADLPGTS